MFKKILVAVLLLPMLACKPSAPKRLTDDQIRSSVVKIYGGGSCSGTQIEAPSGKKYILTAAHCLPIAVDGVMHIQTEDSGSYFSKVIEEDMTSDLLLLEPAPGVPAIKIAKDIGRHEHLKSYTHGHGYPTYQTEGHYVGEDVVQYIEGYIESAEDRAKCSKPKHKIETMDVFGMFTLEVCTVKLVESVTTVKAVPGSSGGLVLNDSDELAGVVSTGNADFTNLVTVKDIQRFLEKR